MIVPRVPDDLRAAAQDLRDAPDWDTVRDDAARLRVAAAQYDAAVVAGLAADSAVIASTDHWPIDVAHAFDRLGLHDKYSPTTLHGVVAHLSTRGQIGLTNSVKGTVFEAQVVDHVNHGELPIAGADHADLARSLNQPGWDATLQSASGQTIGHIQMKETADWHVVAEHLQRYPQFPAVVTTHEAATAAAAHDLGGHVIDSGISDTAVTDHVQAVVDHVDVAHAVHEVVPELALVAILAAATVRLRRGDDRTEVSRWVAEQASISGVANLAALAAQVATGTVVIRPAVTLGTRFAIARAQTSRAVARKLADIHAHLELTKTEFKAGLDGED